MTEITPYLNLGLLGVVAIFAVKQFFDYLNKKPNGNGKGVPPPRLESSDSIANAAGLKSAEWWELTFARIVMKCLEDHENRVHRPVTQEATEARQEMLNQMKTLERQLGQMHADLSRQIRDVRNDS